jgi:hypothetical protein
MKFGKKSIMLLATGIVMIMVICLTTLYNNNGEQQDELLSQLDLIQPVIAKSSTREVSSRIQDIEQRQIEAESQLQEAKAQLQQPINAIVITDTLLDIAQITGVEIDKLNSPGIANTNIGNLGFTVLPIKLEVVGEVTNLIGFIAEFSKTYPTGLIKSVQMNIPTVDEETGEGEPEDLEEVSLPSVNLDIQIYSCEDV